jgi:hypothetical protein
MAWTAPKTWSVGEIATADDFNEQIRDNMGFVWREVAYAQITANVTGITGTNFAGAAAVVTAASTTFDGNPALVEFYAPGVDNTAAGQRMSFALSDGGTDVGILGQKVAAAVSATDAVHLTYRFTPSAAAHTYSIVAYVTANTGIVYAGGGGAGNLVPAYIRILQKGSA